MKGPHLLEPILNNELLILYELVVRLYVMAAQQNVGCMHSLSMRGSAVRGSGVYDPRR